MLLAKSIDVALRIGPLEDLGLIVRKLDDIQLVVCGAPEYLRRRGEPAMPDDLLKQDCLAFGDGPGMADWNFQDGAVRRSLCIPTRLCAMTSTRWSVQLWQGPGSSECRPGRLHIFSLTDGSGLCLRPISGCPRR
jgi:DNA-binding transcriptional LysR family regulator